MSDGTLSHSECNEIQNEPVGYHLDVSGFSGFSRFERQTFRDSGLSRFQGRTMQDFRDFRDGRFRDFRDFQDVRVSVCACVRV